MHSSSQFASLSAAPLVYNGAFDRIERRVLTAASHSSPVAERRQAGVFPLSRGCLMSPRFERQRSEREAYKQAKI